MVRVHRGASAGKPDAQLREPDIGRLRGEHLGGEQLRVRKDLRAAQADGDIEQVGPGLNLGLRWLESTSDVRRVSIHRGGLPICARVIALQLAQTHYDWHCRAGFPAHGFEAPNPSKPSRAPRLPPSTRTVATPTSDLRPLSERAGHHVARNALHARSRLPEGKTLIGSWKTYSLALPTEQPLETKMPPDKAVVRRYRRPPLETPSWKYRGRCLVQKSTISRKASALRRAGKELCHFGAHSHFTIALSVPRRGTHASAARCPPRHERCLGGPSHSKFGLACRRGERERERRGRNERKKIKKEKERAALTTYNNAWQSPESRLATCQSIPRGQRHIRSPRRPTWALLLERCRGEASSTRSPTSRTQIFHADRPLRASTFCRPTQPQSLRSLAALPRPRVAGAATACGMRME